MEKLYRLPSGKFISTKGLTSEDWERIDWMQETQIHLDKSKKIIADAQKLIAETDKLLNK